jgi:MoaA/NifB/PqqE/SkfB family radical SAM enzyme
MPRRPRLKRWLYSPILAQVIVTRRCNLDCGYCNEYDTYSPPVPSEELRRRIDKLWELGTWEIELTGGEPMMHPDIYELIRYAADKGFRKVMLISNGYLWNEEKVRRMNEAGLTDLQVSIDGVETNDTTIKVLRPLKNKLEAIARAAKFRVVLNSVIGSAPPGEALEVVSFAKEKGFRPRVGLLHGHDGQFSLTAEQAAEYVEVKRAIGKGFSESGDYRTRLIETGSAPFKCRGGSRYLYVDEHGVVSWCSQMREEFGKKLDEYGYDDLARQFYTEKSCASSCTIGCVRTCSRWDEWRRQDRQPDPRYKQARELVQIVIRRPGDAPSKPTPHTAEQSTP